MLHDLRIGKPMELAELWTSFEAISELTGIDMPVRTHIHRLRLFRHITFLVSDCSKRKKQRSQRNEGTKETETEEEEMVGGR